MIHTQFSSPIKIFRSDSGGEYLSNKFHQFLTSEGTLAQLSCPGAHTQNGVAKRKHRHILESARTLLIASFVPSHFWDEVVSTVVYLINRQPSTKLSNKCPDEVFFCTPSYDHLRMFGCTCYVLLPPRERTKLSTQSVECVFLGYSSEHKGYRCYDPSSRRIRISHDVTFVENRPFFHNPSTSSTYSSLESTSFISTNTIFLHNPLCHIFLYHQLSLLFPHHYIKNHLLHVSILVVPLPNHILHLLLLLWPVLAPLPLTILTILMICRFI
jgi:hypothetical protein